MTFKKDLLKKYLEKKGNIDWIAENNQGAYRAYQFQFLMKIINNYLPPEDSLTLDIGLDPGNFSIKIAQKNRRVVIGDISEDQLQITREKFEKYGLSKQVDHFALLENLGKLSQFNDDNFDLVLCLSGTISFACENRHKLIEEIIRVTKPGAPFIITVLTKAHFFKEIVKEEKIELFEEATKSGLWEFIESHFKQIDIDNNEPAYYTFAAKELMNLIIDYKCEILGILALAPIVENQVTALQKFRENAEAWENLLSIDYKLATTEGLLESGEQIILIGRKRFY
ncbi:MAG TPA: class I SAM-dependent methyltransferase [candidate division Zixibacteria bacterium]|nr:class I SAM-dependent methyltransferase [candidate division Zixibacteria bacterium]